MASPSLVLGSTADSPPPVWWLPLAWVGGLLLLLCFVCVECYRLMTARLALQAQMKRRQLAAERRRREKAEAVQFAKNLATSIAAGVALFGLVKLVMRSFDDDGSSDDDNMPRRRPAPRVSISRSTPSALLASSDSSSDSDDGAYRESEAGPRRPPFDGAEGEWVRRWQFPSSANSPSFGWYVCSACRHNWMSAYAWRDDWQRCGKCLQKKKKPTEMWLNDPDSETLSAGFNGRKGRPPHQQDLCGRCLRMGKPCWRNKRK